MGGELCQAWRKDQFAAAIGSKHKAEEFRDEAGSWKRKVERIQKGEGSYSAIKGKEHRGAKKIKTFHPRRRAG